MKIRKILEKEMCQELDEGTARTGDDKSAFRKSNEGWMQTKVKVATVDEQIMSVMKHLDNLRTQLILGKAKDQAAVDLNIHWLMVELDTGNHCILLATSSCAVLSIFTLHLEFPTLNIA